MIAATTAVPPALDSTLDAMNARMFGGDLLPWRELRGATVPAADSASAPRSTRFVVDASLPGQRVLERFLNRDRVAASDTASALHLAYFDLARHDLSVQQAEWSRRGITPLFAIRCVVLCDARHRLLVDRLGADTFANLPECPPIERRR
ncbi:MAG: hypothetical protein HOP12_12475 [Candidatus Eisenbacteria bacterium]|uniref:Uncharacterized protein n=1 Tax=Eiseniibacteriota bacterium TaxID=2212470 RepID=A0A849SUA7_UNCEI|nr:hypothetical protein [Candidatus Eisenbacteria bacterium]